MQRTKEDIISEISDLLANMAVGYVSRRAGKPQLLDHRDEAQDNADKTLGVFLDGYDVHSEDTARLMFRFGKAISQELELGEYNYDPYFDVVITAEGELKLSELLRPGANIRPHIQSTTISRGTHNKLLDKDEAELEVILGNLKSQVMVNGISAEFD
ncbi:MAG: hypothetical protein JSR72_20210 [Proteobacteria bacterium]|nr:hypothetical protein [Pseudomonadota bacterium]